MKKNFKPLLFAILLIALTATVSAFPASAASQIKNVVKYTSKSQTFYADLTGNGKSEKVRVVPSVTGYYNLKTVNITVDGQKALSLNVEKQYCYNVSVNYIKMSTRNTFLQVMTYGANDYITLNRIYRYNKSGKKLICVLDLTAKIHYSTAYDVTGVSGSVIKVSNTVQPSETGRINWTDTYKYSGGKFIKTSKKAEVRSSLGQSYYPGDGLEKYFARNKYKTAKNLTFYTTPSQKTKAFTAPKGKFVTLKKIYVNGKNYYLQFSYNGKTGWRKIFNENVYDYSAPDYSKTGWFLGVANRLAG